MHWVRSRSALVLALALGAALLAPVAATAGDAPGAGGMRVYRDPVTGEFTAPPPLAPAPEASGRAAEAAGVAPPELVEEPGASPAGGVTIDLQGRFRSTESATLDGAGDVHTHCQPDDGAAK